MRRRRLGRVVATVLLVSSLFTFAGAGSPGAPVVDAAGAMPGTPRGFIASLAVGDAHNCAIVDNAHIRCWGHNDEGQLGRNDGNAGSLESIGDVRAELGDALPNVETGAGAAPLQISSLDDHTCALFDGGTVRCWGDNRWGQLGRSGGNEPPFDDVGDDPGEMGASLLAVDLGTGRTATAVAAGFDHTCAILDGGDVVCWGDNLDGQLGRTGGNAAPFDYVGDDPGEMGDALSPVDLGTGRHATAIAAGEDFTCALLDDATVKCWGENGDGELGRSGGNGGQFDEVGDDEDEMGDALRAVDLGPGRTATAIIAGDGHACAIRDDRTLVCWGDNSDGQLGRSGGDAAPFDDVGDDPGEMGGALATVELGGDNYPVAVGAGVDFNCALLDDASITCWGDNRFGQLGVGSADLVGDDPGEMGDALMRVDVGPGRTPVAVDSGDDHACAVFGDGAVRCWGSGERGQRADLDNNRVGDEPDEMGDDLERVDLGGATASQIAFGREHACALLGNGTVRCWGANADGGLGYGDRANRDRAAMDGGMLPAIDLGSGLTATAIAAGSTHTCVIVDDTAGTLDGAVKCWGFNGNGELGHGDTSGRGDEPGEMGDELDPVDLGDGLTASALAAGATHTCAILSDEAGLLDGEVKCWGANRVGQLGRSGGNAAPFDDVGDGPGEMGDALDPVDLGEGLIASAIATGSEFTCVIVDDTRIGDVLDGAVKCWGGNDSGQLGRSGGNASSFNRVGDQPGEMGDAILPIDLGTDRHALSISAGFRHACAVLDNMTVKCWGRNLVGQLGYGDSSDRGDGSGEMGDDLPAVALGTFTPVHVAAGESWSCALGAGGGVKCWGSNDDGRLGYGDTTDRGDAEPGGNAEMGANLALVDLGAGRTASATALGSSGTCVLLDNTTIDSNVACWGNEWNGQLGTQDLAARGDVPGELGAALPGAAIGDGLVLPGPSRPGLLDAPTGASADGAVVLSWSAPSDVGSAPLTGYRLERSLDGDQWTTVVENTGSTATSRTMSGLTNGTAYFFRVTAISAVGVGVPSLSSAAVTPASPPPPDPWTTFVPERFADTRPGFETVDGVASGGGPSVGGRFVEVPVAGRGSVPQDAVAVIANVTITGAVAPGFATAYPCGTRPAASTLNFQAERSIANGATIALSATGTLCVFTNQTAQVIVDIGGYLAAGSPVVTNAPERFADTRPGFATGDGQGAGGGINPGGQFVEIPVAGRQSVPADADAVFANVTITGADAAGFAVVYPCGTRPESSSINYQPGESVANNALAALSPSGSVCVFTNQAAHVVFDVNGHLPARTDVVAIGSPRRLADTRPGFDTIDSVSAGEGINGAGDFVEVQVAGRGAVDAGASTAMVNVTVTGAPAAGFATVYGCGTRPATSTLNFQPGRSIANSTLSELSATGSLCVYTNQPAHIIIDVTAHTS